MYSFKKITFFISNTEILNISFSIVKEKVNFKRKVFQVRTKMSELSNVISFVINILKSTSERKCLSLHCISILNLISIAYFIIKDTRNSCWYMYLLYFEIYNCIIFEVTQHNNTLFDGSLKTLFWHMISQIRNRYKFLIVWDFLKILFSRHVFNFLGWKQNIFKGAWNLAANYACFYYPIS